MDASQYKDYILTLLFLKYVSDKAKAADAGTAIVVPEGCSFDDIVALSGKKEMGEEIDKIIAKLANANDLRGVIDVTSFNDDEKLGRAFVAFLESADPRRMPLHGGDATSVVVTLDLQQLRDGLGVALVGDEPISAGEARRLACTANLIPAVLGGDSEILDLGRARRLFSPAQRKAMAVRDRHCRAEGCDIPGTWCEAHHRRDPWRGGGRTDLDDGELLCGHHHHRVHDDGYRTERLPSGDVRFHRRR